MALNETEYTLKSIGRANIRNEVTELFLQEEPGTGKGEDCSRYHYIVEKYDNYSIVIKRPTGLNKGFDFTVNIDGMYFKNNRKYANPRHDDIKEILRFIKNNDTKNYSKVKEQIIKIFNTEEPDIKSIKDICFKDFENKERPIAIILLAMKWLFIEQDITYWNWSGRNMLMNNIKSEGLI